MTITPPANKTFTANPAMKLSPDLFGEKIAKAPTRDGWGRALAEMNM